MMIHFLFSHHWIGLFPIAYSEGFSFYFGGLGVETCSLDVVFVFATVRNCLQPSATARDDCAMAVLMESAAKVVTFEGFKRRARSFRVAGVALREIPACFIACQKSFCVLGAIPMRRFQKMSCVFRHRRSTLETSVVILRGGRTTSDVPCCVFCELHCQGCNK